MKQSSEYSYLHKGLAQAAFRYSDRQEVVVCSHESFRVLITHQNVGYEVRAGLSTVYEQKGWVADDVHSESASRTLAYACKHPLFAMK